MNRADSELLRAQCQRRLDQDATDVDAWEGLGRAEYALGHFEQARAAFEHATRRDPTRQRSWDGLARAEFELGNYAAAIEWFNWAIAVSTVPAEVGVLYTGKGMSWLRLHRPVEADHAFDAAIDVYPNQRLAWQGKGRALLGQRRIGEAFRTYVRSIKLFHATSAEHRWLR